MYVFRKLTLSGWVYLRFCGTHNVYISKSEYENGLIKENKEKLEHKEYLNKLRKS